MNWNAQECARPCLTSHRAGLVPSLLATSIQFSCKKMRTPATTARTKAAVCCEPQLRGKKTTQCSKSKGTEKYFRKQNLVQKSWEVWQDKMLSQASQRINRKVPFKTPNLAIQPLKKSKQNVSDQKKRSLAWETCSSAICGCTETTGLGSD